MTDGTSWDGDLDDDDEEDDDEEEEEDEDEEEEEKEEDEDEDEDDEDVVGVEILVCNRLAFCSAIIFKYSLELDLFRSSANASFDASEGMYIFSLPNESSAVVRD